MEFSKARIECLEKEVARLNKKVEWLEYFKDCIYHNDTILYDSACEQSDHNIN